MKTPKYFSLSLIILAFLVAGCRSCDKSTLEGSIIDEATAITFRNNFLHYPDQNYHIPEGWMFETQEFNALFGMGGIDKIRLYPAINTHDDLDDDSLTFIMVPVNAESNTDNFSGYLFEYAELCPNNCSTPTPTPYSAPIEAKLDLNIPTSWCISQETIQMVFAQATEKVGENNVYGIRFCWYVNDDGIMDLDLRPTTIEDGIEVNIEGLSYKGVTEICIGGKGSCDSGSVLYLPKRQQK